MISAELNERWNRIWVRSDYNIAGMDRWIAGSNFSESNGPHWSCPLSIDTCLLLRERFGSDLQISRPLADWYRAERKARDEMTVLASATEATLSRLPAEAPALFEAMSKRPYQAVGARFVADGRSVLIADEPGLGKTLQVLAGIIESDVDGPYLVICPKVATESVWRREIERWIPGAKAVTFPDGKAARQKTFSAFRNLQQKALSSREPFMKLALAKTFLIINVEMVRVKSFFRCAECGDKTTFTKKPIDYLDCGHEKDSSTKKIDQPTHDELFWEKWGAVVVDESHEALIRKSGTPTQTRNGLELLALREGGLRVAISGTPLRGRPHQLWGTLNWLEPKKFGGFWRWAGTYWETGNRFSPFTIEKLRADREPMLWDSVSSLVLRRVKQEVAKDLPPKSYVGTPLDSELDSPVGVWLPMLPQQAKNYEAMRLDSAVRIEGGTLDAIGHLAEITRLSQFASSAGRMERGEFVPAMPSNKYEWLMQFLEEMGYPDDPTGKVVVASRSRQLLELFEKGLNLNHIGTCSITGKTPGRGRTAILDAFNAPGGPGVMLLSIKAGGVAITIDTASDMVFLDESDPDTMSQVEDRIHRVSNPRPCRYYYLRSLDTVEVGRAAVYAERGADGRRLLDERRGVEFSRRVLELSSRGGK